ncbi:hypothetical protein BDZ89DRAFT_1068843 [Hymenopellis radicata]|nr:hypothetical protein BDZ89DRAFT_1068843 [Hymenopellis radicata]
MRVIWVWSRCPSPTLVFLRFARTSASVITAVVSSSLCWVITCAGYPWSFEGVVIRCVIRVLSGVSSAF